ncbi:hypothetical protein [Viridibacillus arvi]|uniref:hypothetical protein n=1 Tax=Viridibacillus arvi TaxID=263475 RepID=UPI0034CF813C
MTTFSNELPDNIVHSINNYFSNKITYDNLALNKGNQSIYFSWYIEWITYVYLNQKSMWEQIKKHKNNISFVSLIFHLFDKELHVNKGTISKDSISVPLENYFNYANELYIEAYGKELPRKNYKRTELINLIKESEKSIRMNLLNNKKPIHNIIFLH